MTFTADGIKAAIQRDYEDQLTNNNKYILDRFIAALQNDEKLLACTPNSIKSAWKTLWNNQIELDGIGHQLIARDGKMSVHEVLKHTTSEICKKYGVLIVPLVFSVEQVAYLAQEYYPIPDTYDKIPATYHPPSSIKSADTVLIKAVKITDGLILHKATYHRDLLLETARKVMDKNGNILSIVKTRSGIKEYPATSTWQDPSDGLEMLVKTAVRKFIKYFSLLSF